MSLLERLLIQADRALRVVAAPSTQPPPPDLPPPSTLDEASRKHVAGLMRINHSGEVCAQALYFGHAAGARSSQHQSWLLAAAEEEQAHLAWCEFRLKELDARPSVFNSVYYAGCFAMGYASAKISDAVALGFVAETERQVESHLKAHVDALPESDLRSRAILQRMELEEAAHGKHALSLGASPLPTWLTRAMHRGADLLRFLSYRL